MSALAALDRARQAWERSQPQLFLELWPDDGLEDPSLTVRDSAQEAPARTGRIFEPASSPFLPRGGLTVGAEPGRVPLLGIGADGESSRHTAGRPVRSSAPLSTTTGGGAKLGAESRAASQEGA